MPNIKRTMRGVLWKKQRELEKLLVPARKTQERVRPASQGKKRVGGGFHSLTVEEKGARIWKDR